MEAIHIIYKNRRGVTKVPTIPKIKSLNEIIFEVVKRQLHSLKDPPISFTPNAPKNRMWENLCGKALYI